VVNSASEFLLLNFVPDVQPIKAQFHLSKKSLNDQKNCNSFALIYLVTYQEFSVLKHCSESVVNIGSEGTVVNFAVEYPICKLGWKVVE